MMCCSYSAVRFLSDEGGCVFVYMIVFFRPHERFFFVSRWVVFELHSRLFFRMQVGVFLYADTLFFLLHVCFFSYAGKVLFFSYVRTVCFSYAKDVYCFRMHDRFVMCVGLCFV